MLLITERKVRKILRTRQRTEIKRKREARTKSLHYEPMATLYIHRIKCRPRMAHIDLIHVIKRTRYPEEGTLEQGITQGYDERVSEGDARDLCML